MTTQKQSKLKDYSYIIFGATLVALAYNIFFLPAKLAAGGISGVSTILYELFGYSPSLVQTIVNIPIFLIGWLTLGKNFTLKTLVGTFWVPLVIFLTKDIPIA